jgi:hypothetical protein
MGWHYPMGLDKTILNCCLSGGITPVGALLFNGEVTGMIIKKLAGAYSGETGGNRKDF